MIRDSAHGSPLFQTAFLSSQRNFQFLGRSQSVLKKHLVKISKSVKQNAVRILLLGFHILGHHW